MLRVYPICGVISQACLPALYRGRRKNARTLILGQNRVRRQFC